MNRSDIMECLESLAGQAKSVPDAESVPAVDVKILDGAAIVHMLDPKKSRLPCQNAPGLFTIGVLGTRRKCATRCFSHRYCLGCIQEGQSEGASTTESWILVIVSKWIIKPKFLLTGETSFSVTQTRTTCSGH